MTWLNEIRSELRSIPSGAKDLRKFGLTLGIAFGLLGAWTTWRHKSFSVYLLGISAFFLISSWFAPRVLRPIQKAWMALALVIGGVMSRVLLAVMFYLVLTPLAVVSRIFGKRFLDRTFRDTKDSAWKPHEPRDRDSYERQF